MMAVTPYLKLQKPPFDSIPWDDAVNGNMDILDAFIKRYMAVPNYAGLWTNNTVFTAGQNVLDGTDGNIYTCMLTHTSAVTPTTFAQDRAAHPTYWAVTLAYASANSNISVSDTPPVGAKSGDFWFATLEASLYIMYNDGNSMQWVVCTNQPGNVGEAPQDGHTYARRNGAWIQIA